MTWRRTLRQLLHLGNQWPLSECGGRAQYMPAAPSQGIDRRLIVKLRLLHDVVFER